MPKTERFEQQAKKYKLWQAQVTARELLNRLQNLATHEEPGHYGGEITAVRDILNQLEVEEQYA